MDDTDFARYVDLDKIVSEYERDEACHEFDYLDEEGL